MFTACIIFLLEVDELTLPILCLESGEGHSDENRVSQDNKKRRLKTPSQITALEKFYDGKNASRFQIIYCNCLTLFFFTML